MTVTQIHHVRTLGYTGNPRGTALTIIGEAHMPDGSPGFIRCVRDHLPIGIDDFRGMTVFDVSPQDLVGYCEEVEG